MESSQGDNFNEAYKMLSNMKMEDKLTRKKTSNRKNMSADDMSPAQQCTKALESAARNLKIYLEFVQSQEKDPSKNSESKKNNRELPEHHHFISLINLIIIFEVLDYQ